MMELLPAASRRVRHAVDTTTNIVILPMYPYIPYSHTVICCDGLVACIQSESLYLYNCLLLGRQYFLVLVPILR